MLGRCCAAVLLVLTGAVALPSAAGGTGPADTVPVYVAVLSTTATTADDRNGSLEQPEVARAIAELDDYLREQTDGRERVVLAGYERISTPDDTCRDTADHLLFARRHAFGGRYIPATAPGTLLVLTSERWCTDTSGRGGGNAAISMAGIEPDGMMVFTHEYLHTLGLGHGNRVDCSGPTYDLDTPAFATDGCRVVGYGDSLTVMGSAKTPSVIGSLHRTLMGWWPSGTTIAATYGHDLTAVLPDLATGTGPRVVSLTDPRSGVPYTVEYRTDVLQRDRDSFWWDLPGVDRAVGSVRVLRPQEWPCDMCGSVVVSDLTEPFTAASGAFSLTAPARDPDAGAQVVLRWAGRVATSTGFASVAVRPDRSVGRVRLSIDARTADGFPLRGRSFRVYDGDRLVGATQSSDTLEIVGLSPGAHRLRVALEEGPSYEASSVEQVVTIPRGAVEVYVPRHAVRHLPGRTTVRVSVIGPKEELVDGRVRLVQRGRVLATNRVHGTWRASVLLKVPAAELRRGKVRIRYSGNDRIAAGWSRRIGVRR